MKKLLLSIAIVATGFAAFAQKPVAGNITTEMGLSSVLGTPVAPATINTPAALGMLRGRYFLSSDMAIRGSIGFGMGTTKTIVDDDGLPTVVDKSEKTVSTSTFGLAIGIEKHLPGTAKLSPYIGGEIGFGSQTSTNKVTNSTNGSTFTKGDSYSTSGGGIVTFAFNAMVGADYYITDKVYLGAELGVGLFNMTSTAESKAKNNAGEKVLTNASSTTNFGVQSKALGLVRIGIILF